MAIKSHTSTNSDSSLKRTEIIDEADSELVFADAMADVKRLDVKKTAPRVNGLRRCRNDLSEDSSISELLNEFVSGQAEFDWSLHPEYREGGPEQHNRKLIRKLRRGGFAVQAQVDLHGLSQKEAEVQLDIFLEDCISQNLRCVRIIHGKGNNSLNQDGVLRQAVPKWLSTKRRARLIIAYTTAPPRDGGIGATYVLLRRQPLSRKSVRNNAGG